MSRARRIVSALRGGWRYRGLMVLVLWQVPVQPVVRPNGSLGFMIGAGTAETAELSCEGDVLSSARVTYRGAAVHADYDVAPRTRFDGVIGFSDSDTPWFDGSFGTVQVRHDWRKVGVGVGLAWTPGTDFYSPNSGFYPAGHLRFGDAERVHARLDIFPPSALASQQVVRAGLGVNSVNRAAPAGFLGFAVLGTEEGRPGVAGELTLPLSTRVAIRGEGHLGSGHEHNYSGAGVGLRFSLGRSAQALTR